MTKIDQASLQKLLELIGGDNASLVELIGSFLTEGPTLVESLEQAEAKNDMETMRRAAHTLKSSARDFGALDLSEYCSTLEAQCRASEPVDSLGQISQISQEFDSIRIELESFVSDLN